MRVVRYIFIAMIFICLLVGLVMVFMNKMFVPKKKYTEEVAHRKALKIKLIGYIFMMLSLAFAIFQSLLK